jgi:hypothetical protein
MRCFSRQMFKAAELVEMFARRPFSKGFGVHEDAFLSLLLWER